jgi:hypothetical protein
MDGLRAADERKERARLRCSALTSHPAGRGGSRTALISRAGLTPPLGCSGGFTPPLGLCCGRSLSRSRAGTAERRSADLKVIIVRMERNVPT